MFRKMGAVALASALMVSSGTAAFAASSGHAVLAPGKPAGVKEAAHRAPMWIWIAGVGFVALGTGLIFSGGGGHSTTTTTSTTGL